MGQKTIPRQTGHYPFGSKNRLRQTRLRTVELPALAKSSIQALSRFPHWNRSKPVKAH